MRALPTIWLLACARTTPTPVAVAHADPPIDASVEADSPIDAATTSLFDAEGLARPDSGTLASGKLDKAGVLRVVLAREQALRQCYAVPLDLKNPYSTVRGTVTGAWRIEVNGTVSGAKIVQDPWHDTNARECVLREIRSWHFPAPAEPVDLTFPFQFGCKL